MKKILLLILLCAPLFAFAAGVGVSGSGVGGMPSSPKLSGTLSSTKACASGFTRIGPNYCQWQSNSNQIGWTDATACTGHVLTSNAVPSDAKSVVFVMQWWFLAGNAVGLRANAVNFWATTNCTGSFVSTYAASVYEHVAVTAGTAIGRQSVRVVVPLPATNTFYTTESNAGGNGNADVELIYVEGYFD